MREAAAIGPAGPAAAREDPAGTGRGATAAARLARGCAALAFALALSGCGGVATVGSTLYSTTEAIATAVKDAMRERTESPATPGNVGSETGTLPGGREEP